MLDVKKGDILHFREKHKDHGDRIRATFIVIRVDTAQLRVHLYVIYDNYSGIPLQGLQRYDLRSLNEIQRGYDAWSAESYEMYGSTSYWAKAA